MLYVTETLLIFVFTGALKNLRESTSNEKVRKYHKEFYRPENLTVLITGQVKHADVFKAVQPIEQKIISKVFIYVYIYIYIENLCVLQI